MLTLASDAVADEVVPFVVAVLDRSSRVEILIALLAHGRDSEKVVRVRKAGGRVGVADSEAKLRVAIEVVADVRG